MKIKFIGKQETSILFLEPGVILSEQNDKSNLISRRTIRKTQIEKK